MTTTARSAFTLDSFLTDSKAVGGIYKMAYDSALVLTDDLAKKEAGGVPMGAFLLAAAGSTNANGDFEIDDDEVILLKVRGTTPLPHENELIQVRMEVVANARATKTSFKKQSDVLTDERVQQSAFECEILGTFYRDVDTGHIAFGSDIDNVVSAIRYQVFVPGKATLSYIASYSENAAPNNSVQVGVVRYTSTRRRAQVAGMADAAVNVDITDVIARKTAVFGMTRTGKSNTIKTVATAVAQHASIHRKKIGQIIFDPQGEYANENTQDGTALVALGGPDQVRIYRLGDTGNNPQVFPLEMNFYDPDNLGVVTEFINAALLEEYSQYAYVNAFTAIEWDEPDRDGEDGYSAYVHWQRARLGFYALLYAQGYKGSFPAPTTTSRSSRASSQAGITFTWQEAAHESFMAAYPDSKVVALGSSSTYLAPTPKDALEVFSFMGDKEMFGIDKEYTWRGKTGNLSPANALFTVLIDNSSARSLLQTMRDFHSEQSQARVEDNVWDDMVAGRISIIDLSRGNEKVSKMISERLVNRMLERANDRFRSNLPNVDMQIVVEEAHNLFERGAKEVAGNPWVRLSKEAAKYGMGLVYATQEISSVDKRILSNTSNWFVAHLNSKDELRELSRYYDFAAWENSLLKSDDRGFVRLKTHSAKYSVPVQIAKFDLAMVNDARAAAGLPRIGEIDTTLDDDDAYFEDRDRADDVEI